MKKYERSKEEKVQTEILLALKKLEYITPVSEMTFLANVLMRQINSCQDWMRKMALDEVKKIILEEGEKQ